MKNSVKKQKPFPTSTRNHDRKELDHYKTEIKESPPRSKSRDSYMKPTFSSHQKRSRSRSPEKDEGVQVVSANNLQFYNHSKHDSPPRAMIESNLDIDENELIEIDKDF